MPPLDMEKAWADFLIQQGEDIEEYISDELNKSRETFSFQDGSHAKWIDSKQVGILLTFSVDELAKVLAAWDEAYENHNDFAADFIMQWVSPVMNLLERTAEAPLDEMGLE